MGFFSVKRNGTRIMKICKCSKLSNITEIYYDPSHFFVVNYNNLSKSLEKTNNNKVTSRICVPYLAEKFCWARRGAELNRITHHLTVSKSSSGAILLVMVVRWLARAVPGESSSVSLPDCYAKAIHDSWRIEWKLIFGAEYFLDIKLA